MMRLRYSILVCFCVIAVASSNSSRAYSVADNWCNRDNLGVNVNGSSFDAHNFSSAIMDQHLRTGATWWSSAQAGIRFQYGTSTTSTMLFDPGPVVGRCTSEDSMFSANPGFAAYAQWDGSWEPSCDWWGENIKTWNLRIHMNKETTCGNNLGSPNAGVGELRS